MLEKWKSSSLAEKIGIVGLLVTMIAILVVCGIEIFSENGAPDFVMSALICADMAFAAMTNWKDQRALAYVNLGIGAVVLVCAVIIAVVK